MKKIIFVLILFFLSLSFPYEAIAQAYMGQEYIIEDFQSKIEVNRDTSLTVTETIKVNFLVPKHGIFRVVPYVYYANGETINSRLKVQSILDEKGNSYKHSKSKFRESIKIKIGDSRLTLRGKHTYVIKYQVFNVLRRYQSHDEVYWNVTGHEWDVPISKASAVLFSRYAKIEKVECFNCISSSSETSANFTSKNLYNLGKGTDFTIVVALDKTNSLLFPSFIQKVFRQVIDNWIYGLAVLPFLVVFVIWFKKGRDLKYEGDNVYYKPEIEKIVSTSPFKREHLPLVYSPINGLTPSELGTIVDEKVDIADVVAEVIELARLEYLTIKEIERPDLFRKKKDYLIIRSEKETSGLEKHQLYLLDSIFSTKISSKTIQLISKIYRNDAQKQAEMYKLAVDDKLILTSAFKNTFYEHLQQFRKRLYEDVKARGFFSYNPESIRANMFSCLYLFSFVIFLIIPIENSSARYVLLLASTLGFFFTRAIPRRTPWGHSLFRQAKGLAFYIEKGKWRYEIAEKNLFIEEMLPLAISLGVVDKLTRQMKEMEIPPPAYFTVGSYSAYHSSMNSFSKGMAGAMTSTLSGKSSWSGGSGFGGGGGSGFGGGGGGSW